MNGEVARGLSCARPWHNMPTECNLEVAGMPTRNVVLTERQAELVERLVREGRTLHDSMDLACHVAQSD